MPKKREKWEIERAKRQREAAANQRLTVALLAKAEAAIDAVNDAFLDGKACKHVHVEDKARQHAAAARNSMRLTRMSVRL